MFLNLSLYDAIIPRGTPIIKHSNTETKTEDNVIIDCGQIPQAPIKSNNKIVINANLIPTVKYPMLAKTANVYHQGVCVKKVSNGRNKFKYTKALNPFEKAIKPSSTVNEATAFEIGCLIDNFHSFGNDPIS